MQLQFYKENEIELIFNKAIELIDYLWDRVNQYTAPYIVTTPYGQSRFLPRLSHCNEKQLVSLNHPSSNGEFHNSRNSHFFRFTFLPLYLSHTYFPASLCSSMIFLLMAGLCGWMHKIPCVFQTLLQTLYHITRVRHMKTLRYMTSYGGSSMVLRTGYIFAHDVISRQLPLEMKRRKITSGTKVTNHTGLYSRNFHRKVSCLTTPSESEREYNDFFSLFAQISTEPSRKATSFSLLLGVAGRVGI